MSLPGKFMDYCLPTNLGIHTLTRFSFPEAGKYKVQYSTVPGCSFPSSNAAGDAVARNLKLKGPGPTKSRPGVNLDFNSTLPAPQRNGRQIIRVKRISSILLSSSSSSLSHELQASACASFPSACLTIGHMHGTSKRSTSATVALPASPT